MSTRGSGASRAGGKDFHNEDAFLVDEGLGLYVVCDGASGTAAGEVAAHTVVEALERFVEVAERELDLGEEALARAVVGRAMAHAIDALKEAEESDPTLHGLSTTVTMLLTHGHLGVIGHRGDSRAYLIRRDRSRQLTVDDELTESQPGVGERGPGFDVFSLELRPGDTLLLCTDGAEAVVQEGTIERTAGGLSPQVLASRIVSAAHRLAPTQDATVVVVRVRRDAEPGWLELSAPPRRTAFGHTIPASPRA